MRVIGFILVIICGAIGFRQGGAHGWVLGSFIGLLALSFTMHRTWQTDGRHGFYGSGGGSGDEDRKSGSARWGDNPGRGDSSSLGGDFGDSTCWGDGGGGDGGGK